MLKREGRGKGLDAAGKAQLLAQTRQAANVPIARAVPAMPPPAANAAWTDFKTLDAYQKINTQRQAADILGLRNPFLREHEARAGATTVIGGKTCLNFSSYDYLGLNQSPEVGAAAAAAIEKYGTSVSASRVVAGERPFHRDLEAALARLYHAEDAAVFVSGHATNVAVISTLLGPRDLVVYDSYSHNSIVVGAELSGAVRRSFAHDNLDQLEALLADIRPRHERVLIAVEGLYSMDGDVPDLARLIDLKRRFGAWLMVDEAHALGVLGATGRGTAEHAGIDPNDVDIWMGTLSKTLAACGGYVAGRQELVDLMKMQAAGFVYSVGLSPPLAAAARAALAIMEREPERVQRLQRNGRHFLATARAAGLDTGHGQGFAVAPIQVGDSLKAVAVCERLLERGINVLPIIFPAVPMQGARLRFFITSEHTSTQIETAVATVRQELDALSELNFSLETLIAEFAKSAG